MKIKIFCDIAEINQIKKFNKKKIVKGFTTNPSLMRNAGAKDYESYSNKILKICNNKPVSLEVFADNYKDMKKQAIKINSWAKNVYVKIPVVNSRGKFMGKIIKELKFPDHYNYTDNDIIQIKKMARSLNAEIITTEKDYIKLNSNNKKDIKCLYVKIKIFNQMKLINYIRSKFYE